MIEPSSGGMEYNLIELAPRASGGNIDYHVVKVNSGPREGTYFVVPMNWVFTTKGPVPGLDLVKLMDESDLPEDKLLFNQMIEKKAPPPEAWSFHYCDVLHSTGSLIDAYQVVKQYETNNVEIGKKRVNARKAKGSKKNNDMNLAKRAALVEKSNILLGQCQQPITDELNEVSAMEIVDAGNAFENSNGFAASVHKDDNKENLDGNDLSSGFDGVSNKPSLPLFDAVDDKLNRDELNPDISIMAPNKTNEIEQIQDFKLILEEFKAFKASVDSIKKDCSTCLKKVENIENSLRGLKVNLIDIAKDVNELKTFVQDKRQLQENVNIITFSKLKSMHNLQLPFQELDEFLKFDQNLNAADNKLRNDLETHFFSTINTTITKLDKALSPILKNFLTQPVSKKMVAVKAIKGKVVFCETTFGKILKECFLNSYANPETAGEKDFESAVSTVLNNARDWGGRKANEQQEQENITPD